MSFDRSNVVGLHYVSLYFHDLERAIAYYTAVFGPPEEVLEAKTIWGWEMGNTHLTLFSSKIGTDKERNPCNTEFAIQVERSEQVDELTQLLVQHGGQVVMAPEDTWMYRNMRFAAIDDPFGVRIDVFCPLPAKAPSESTSQ